MYDKHVKDNGGNIIIVMMNKLSLKMKLPMDRSTYVPGLTYGQELLVVTERMRSKSGPLRDRVQRSNIQEDLGVPPMLLHVRRKQSSWFGHLIMMPTGHIDLEIFQAVSTGRRPQCRPRTQLRGH